MSLNKYGGRWMLKIAICDDEMIEANYVESLILKIVKGKGLLAEIDVFVDALDMLNKGESIYDIIYLDIELGSLNGVQVARKIREQNKNIILIFISAYDSYLRELFEVNTFRFIDKPINEATFYKYFEEAYDKICLEGIYFEYEFNREAVKVEFGHISYFESKGRYILLHTDKSIERFIGKLDEVEKIISQYKITFLRIHQSYLVSYKFVKSVARNKLLLEDGTILPISNDRQKIVKREFYQKIEDEIYGKC